MNSILARLLSALFPGEGSGASMCAIKQYWTLSWNQLRIFCSTLFPGICKVDYCAKVKLKSLAKCW